MRPFALILSVTMLLALAACTSSESSPTPEPIALTPTPTLLPPEVSVPLAFQQTDPATRRTAVLVMVGRYLNDPSIQYLPDDEASARLTELAFASQRLTLSDPAFVRRDEDRAVVALPDGLGLYFFDLRQPTEPIEISAWAVGVTSLNPVWREGEIGIAYETLSTDGFRIMHFALIVEKDGRWSLHWLSDDEPEWWFNARDAALDIESDLSTVTITGYSEASPLIFAEDEGHPRRAFQVVWEQVEEEDRFAYRSQTPWSAYPTREAWLWDTAIPSPYATLVEFVERLQREDLDGASELSINRQVIETAEAFGFYLIDRPYEVILSEPERLIIQGRQGTFEITFRAPRAGGDRWLITDITPTGAQ